MKGFPFGRVYFQNSSILVQRLGPLNKTDFKIFKSFVYLNLQYFCIEDKPDNWQELKKLRVRFRNIYKEQPFGYRKKKMQKKYFDICREIQ